MDTSPALVSRAGVPPLGGSGQGAAGRLNAVHQRVLGQVAAGRLKAVHQRGLFLTGAGNNGPRLISRSLSILVTVVPDTSVSLFPTRN